ncbi:MAG TPA: methyltransferase domain-containing protein [Acidimicrobiales bacterium]|jgi:ubiquinone/menaquinone biosynthesis C-methylase UbiE
MTDVTYTHGHHDSVLRSHRWRTAENSAGYLLGHLRPGMTLLDVGCGPGTISCDLAERLAPGPVVGIDASETVITEARARAAESGPPTVSFEVGSLFDLRFDDGSFDVVHAHQVLQHLGDPMGALTEMRRVCRPGGIVAARDGDYPAFRWFPDDPELDRALAAYGALTRANGANWDAGRRLLAWAHRVGFESVVPSASVWCFATPEDRAWWGDLWADRYTVSSLAEQLLAQGIAGEDDLASFADAYRRWAGSPDGWMAVLHGEVICTV